MCSMRQGADHITRQNGHILWWQNPTVRGRKKTHLRSDGW